MCAGPLPGYGFDVLLFVTGAISTWLQPVVPGRRRMGGGFRLPPASSPWVRRPQVESIDPRRLSLPWMRSYGHIQDFARGPHHSCQPLCQPRNGERLGQHPDVVSAMSQAQNREGNARVESSGKPDAWKLARPVWGWGRGVIPRPTPQK